MELKLLCPEDYQPLLGIRQTEAAIRQIKEFFQTNLAFELNLMRAAPLFVLSGTGINDDLNGSSVLWHFQSKDER
jgi:aspartate--ammonia ligase